MSGAQDSLQQARQAAFTEASRLVLGYNLTTAKDIAAHFKDIATVADSLVAYYTSGEVVIPSVSGAALPPHYRLHELRSSALTDAYYRRPEGEAWNMEAAVEAAENQLAYTLYGIKRFSAAASSAPQPHPQGLSPVSPGLQSLSEGPECQASHNRSSSSPVVRVASATVAEPGAGDESASGEAAFQIDSADRLDARRLAAARVLFGLVSSIQAEHGKRATDFYECHLALGLGKELLELSDANGILPAWKARMEAVLPQMVEGLFQRVEAIMESAAAGASPRGTDSTTNSEPEK